MYGHGTREVLDLFMPEGAPKGLVVFVHGGYWMKFDRSYWSHLAAGAQAQGWAVAMPSYDLCPRVRIADITRQIANAVAVAAREIGGLADEPYLVPDFFMGGRRKFKAGGSIQMNDGLTLRGGRYSVVVNVPKDLVERIGKKQIWKSTGTGNKVEARRKSLLIRTQIFGTFDRERIAMEGELMARRFSDEQLERVM